jgi:PhnB protein
MTKTTFAPKLYIPLGTRDIDFYKRAFGAVEQQRWSNDDGTIHVAEFTIGDAMFHLHEANHPNICFSPALHNGTTVVIGLFVDDVDAVMASAIAAGAKELNPATDYDYHYRQGDIMDIFGHHWTIQKKI